LSHSSFYSTFFSFVDFYHLNCGLLLCLTNDNYWKFWGILRYFYWFENLLNFSEKSFRFELLQLPFTLQQIAVNKKSNDIFKQLKCVGFKIELLVQQQQNAFDILINFQFLKFESLDIYCSPGYNSVQIVLFIEN
jgi:hypothetical protein